MVRLEYTVPARGLIGFRPTFKPTAVVFSKPSALVET
jgi:predicted membrane GTPase involved in stress response